MTVNLLDRLHMGCNQIFTSVCLHLHPDNVFLFLEFVTSHLSKVTATCHLDTSLKHTEQKQTWRQPNTGRYEQPDVEGGEELLLGRPLSAALQQLPALPHKLLHRVSLCEQGSDVIVLNISSY